MRAESGFSGGRPAESAFRWKRGRRWEERNDLLMSDSQVSVSRRLRSRTSRSASLKRVCCPYKRERENEPGGATHTSPPGSQAISCGCWNWAQADAPADLIDDARDHLARKHCRRIALLAAGRRHRCTAWDAPMRNNCWVLTLNLCSTVNSNRI